MKQHTHNSIAILNTESNDPPINFKEKRIKRISSLFTIDVSEEEIEHVEEQLTQNHGFFISYNGNIILMKDLETIFLRGILPHTRMTQQDIKELITQILSNHQTQNKTF